MSGITCIKPPFSPEILQTLEGQCSNCCRGKILKSYVDFVSADRICYQTSPYDGSETRSGSNPVVVNGFIVARLHPKRPGATYIDAICSKVKGLGTLLLGKCMSSFRPSQNRRVWLHSTDDAMEFWKKRGFLDVSQRRTVLNPNLGTLMHRNLSLAPFDS